MPQSVSIQTDNVVNTKPTHTKEVSKDNSFSETLDKHIQTAEKKSSESNKASTLAEQSENKIKEQPEKEDAKASEAEAKTEKTDADDGNKLPSDEKTSESKHETKEQDDTDADDSLSETEIEADAGVVTQQNTLMLAAEPETKVTTVSNDKATVIDGSDKPAMKKTTVDAPVQSSPAETLTKSSTATSADPALINKKQPDANLVTVTDTEKAVIKQTQTTTDSDKVPNFAKALQSMNEAEGKTSEIRADIMDAIKRQRQNGEGEQGTTVRNLIAAQTENQDKADIDLPGIRADKSLQERLLGVSPSTGNSANTSTVSTPSVSGATTSSSTLSLPVQPNIQSSAWSQVMNSRVVWMAKEGIQQAEMKMNPANLGPVEVKLHVQNEQASVTFLAQHSTTRDALEQALPKLRDSFAENGIQLTHAEVGQQQHQQQREDQPQQTQNSQNFTQASSQSDDIINEADETIGSTTLDSGLSLYV